MKILQVSQGFPPRENAGVELYTFNLSKALAARNHPVHIFCREEDTKKEEFSSYEEEMDGLGVTRVINNFTWKSESDPRLYYDNSFFDKGFSDILKRKKPDLVHFQHIIGHSAHLVRIAKEMGYPLVFTLHDFFILCPRIQLLKGDLQPCHGPLYGLECVSCVTDIFRIIPPRDIRTRFFLKVKDRLPFPVIKWTKRFFLPPKFLHAKGYEVFHRYRYMYEILKLCDLLLTPSQYVKDLFLKYYSSFEPKIRVLSLGIPPIHGPHRSKLTDKKVRFCYLGNILPFKGVHILINTFKALPRGKAGLTIYGSRKPFGESYAYYDGLKEQTAGFPIEFRGSYQREDLPEVLRDQDVLVLPSIWPETFSLVIREANLMGLPVIASRIGAIPEAVEEGVNGILFEPGNGEELRRAMLRFIEDPELVRKMAAHMPKAKFIEEHAMELEGIYRGIIGIYDRVLKKKRGE
jgi:glycosyltransferase involved in cell wall biosynthesis